MSAVVQTEQTKQRLAEGKSLGGRPTKCNQQVLRNARHYLNHYLELCNKIPSIAGMSKHLVIPRETLHIWANDETKWQFRYILSKLQAAQECALLDNGLDGTWNSAITKLVLSKHGYTENAGNSGTSVNVTINRDTVQIETGGQTLDVELPK